MRNCPEEWTKVEQYQDYTYQVVDYCYVEAMGECVVRGAIQFQGGIIECYDYIGFRKMNLI